MAATRQILEHDLAVNGPLPASSPDITYSSAAPAYWVTGKSAKEVPGHRSITIWAADRSLPASRVVDEEKSGELLFFSTSTPAADPETSVNVHLHLPVLSEAEAVLRARKFLCYLRKTEWLTCPIELRKDGEQSQSLWSFVIRRKDRVIQMTILKQTGGLIYLAVLPARKRPHQNCTKA